MRYRYSLASNMLVLSVLALGGIACGTGEAKPASPLYTAPVYSYPVASSPPGHSYGYEGQSQPSISISGQGRATAPPDAALIRVSISAQASTAAEARDDGKAAIGRLLDTARQFGVEGKDVETRTFSISPVTERDKESDKSRIVGYKLHNTSELTVRDVEGVGELLDELVSDVGEPLKINGITLSIEDPTEIRRQAREKAMQDAHARAQQLAELAGVALGPPLSISESFQGDPSGQLGKEVLVTPIEEGVTPVSVGELEAAVEVFVVYSLAVQ